MVHVASWGTLGWGRLALFGVCLCSCGVRVLVTVGLSVRVVLDGFLF